MRGRNVHLVGSMPMPSTQDVFEKVSAALGARIKRIPDGETGERAEWITWLEPVFATHPAFQKSGEFFRVHATGTGRERYTLKPGATPQEIRFDNLFYADIARQSYGVFKRLKDAGRIPPGTRFQVDLVPAHSVIWLFLVDKLHAAIDPIYNEAVKREIDKIAADIPHEELAIQFDVASAVFARLERAEPSSYGRTKAETQETFSNIVADLGNRVPAGVELLYHLCYGDSNHRHVVEPTDMGDMVEFANRISRQIRRPIALIHMPVPRDRYDDAYFEPLNVWSCGPRPSCASNSCITPTGWRARAGASPPRRSMSPTSPLRPSVASVGAIRAPLRTCCASMPRSPTWTEGAAGVSRLPSKGLVRSRSQPQLPPRGQKNIQEKRQ